MIKEKKEFSSIELADAVWKICEGAYTYSSPWNLKQFTDDILSENSYYFLVEKENRIVAFVNFHCILDEAELINIAVLPDYQGQQLAKQLIGEMMLKLKKLKIKQIFLEVRKKNEQAIQLYNSIGFTIISNRKNYYTNPKEDGLVMSLEIEQEVKR